MFWIIIIVISIIIFISVVKQPMQDIKQPIKKPYFNEAEYEFLLKKTQEITDKNKIWNDEFSKLTILRREALEFEKNNELEKALKKHLEAYEYGHNSQILNISNYAYDIDRIAVLYSKLKQKDDLVSFLTEAIENYPNYRHSKNWILRLTKITGANNETIFNEYSENIETLELNNSDNLCKMILDLKNSFPEFDFYYKKPEDESTLSYSYNNNTFPLEKSKEYAYLREQLNIIFAKAKLFENNKDYESAIGIYKNLISQNIESNIPYNRLMTIYKKLKQPDKEIDVIKQAIHNRESFKYQQRENILAIAKKYGKEEFAFNYIKNGKRIQYYLGIFDLYNPNTEIEKWKDRLIKINHIK